MTPFGGGHCADPCLQYNPPEKLTLKLKIGDEEISEEGEVFSEATFISE